MDVIFSATLGLDDISDDDVLWELIEKFALQNIDIKRSADIAPLFLVNGSDDPYVPATDVSQFEGIENISTWLVPDSGHCASRKAAEIFPKLISWLKEKLY